MIELQKFWDNIIVSEEEIERSNKSISIWNQKVEEKKKGRVDLSSEIKNIKMTINQKEIELTEKEEKSLKLEDRRNILKTEKELQALESELKKILTQKNSLEEELIELFDKNDDMESELSVMNSELEESISRADKDIENLKNGIDRYSESIEENKKKFEELVTQLSVDVKSRFIKLIKSSNNKAIVSLEEETCEGCNFKIPFHIVMEVLKGDQVITCTNCGKFIYRKSS
ncbi:MAG: C4-type zinc ribbon domain-containing protein [Spirochaetota bacterium]|nr:C4-type zinc ribbon domain-containing protein [Spirochaetota bacterium]